MKQKEMKISTGLFDFRMLKWLGDGDAVELAEGVSLIQQVIVDDDRWKRVESFEKRNRAQRDRLLCRRSKLAEVKF